MVFFTCNACGESLKKAQVDKHVMKCRNCEVLSCIDCGKDFWYVSFDCAFTVWILITISTKGSQPPLASFFKCLWSHRGDDYKDHNKCISEDQKYGGKGYETKSNKGDIKQQQWIQVNPYVCRYRYQPCISACITLIPKQKAHEETLGPVLRSGVIRAFLGQFRE